MICERCGSKRFDTEHDGRYAVCLDCGMESQEFQNTAFDAWEEEAALYTSGGRLLRRREKTGRKSGATNKKARPPLPELDALLDGLGAVARAVAGALVRDCGVAEGCVAAVDEAWRAYAAAARRGDGGAPAAKRRKVPSASRDAARSRERRRRLKGEQGPAPRLPDAPPPPPDDGVDGAARDADARENAGVEAVLPLVYAACRRGAVDLSACDLSAWAWAGAIPYLGCWRRGLGDDARRRLGPGGALLFAPERAPAPGEILLAAELRFAGGAPWPPLADDAGLAAAARALVADGPLREALGAGAARLLRLARAAGDDGPAGDARAAAALVAAARRYYAPGELRGAAEPPAVPWALGGAARAPAAYAAFVAGALRDRVPSTDPSRAAGDRFADALDARARAVDAGENGDGGDDGADEGDDDAAAGADDADAGDADDGAAALLVAAADRLDCPPPLLEGQVARLEAAVDAAVAAGDRRLGDDLDADRAARCRVVDGLSYGDLKRRCAAAGVDTRVRGGDGGDKGKRRRRKRRVLAARLLDG